jgi:hypothetical protein
LGNTVSLPRLRQCRERKAPVFRDGRKTPAFEMSMLNAAVMFNVEHPTAWN